MAVVVHPADLQDRDGAQLVIAKMQGQCPRLQLVWADAAYSGPLIRVGQDPDRLDLGDRETPPRQPSV